MTLGLGKRMLLGRDPGHHDVRQRGRQRRGGALARAVQHDAAGAARLVEGAGVQQSAELGPAQGVHRLACFGPAVACQASRDRGQGLEAVHGERGERLVLGLLR